MAAVLVVAVVAMAYGSAAPSLAVAEFSPSARTEISAPPTTETPAAAGGQGPGGRRSTTTTVPPASATTADPSAVSGAPTTRVTRSRACFGDPPRQLSDPQAPPCVAAIFDGENGGATASGVSETEIRVAYQMTQATAADQRRAAAITGMFDYFNRHFEFYGRRLVPVFVEPGETTTTPGQRAAAADIASRNVFAALGTLAPRWRATMVQTLASKGVISVTSQIQELFSDRLVYDALHPYAWGVFPSAEQTWRELGAFACSSLAGRKAIHAGSAVRDRTRKFGVIASGRTTAPYLGPLLEALEACDINPVVVEHVLDRDNLLTPYAVLVERLRAAGVTTFVCACADDQTLNWISAMNAMTTPETGLEWLGPLFTLWNTQENWLQAFASESQMFGLQPLPKLAPVQSQPWFRAALEFLPDVSISQDFWLEAIYPQLMVLASGIQGAGPTLTADAFGQALMSLEFSNPGAGQAPDWQASVGFGPGDHTFYDDFALSWWSPTAAPVGPATQPGKGSWCYVGGGTRYAEGRYPADVIDRFFNPAEPCR